MDARISVRLALYIVMALTPIGIVGLAAAPLVMRNINAINDASFYAVVAGAIPFLIMRTRLFGRLVETSPGSTHPLARLHSALFKLFACLTLVIMALIIWRANEEGPALWKTAFLLVYGLFLFVAAGWLIDAPKFLLKALSRRE